MLERIKGEAHPRFEHVRQVFARNFEEGLDIGAALCIYHQGHVVVNLWGGERASGRPWDGDTLVPLTSVTKAVLSTLVLMLAQEKALDIDAPVRDYWPEFGQNGKADITVRHALSHRAGIPAFDHPISLEEQISRTRVIDSLASMRPVWEPGTAHGYHAITLGFILTEILRRVTGSVGRELMRKRVQEPLGIGLDLAIEESEISNVAHTIAPSEERLEEADVLPGTGEFVRALRDPNSLMYRATFGSSAMTFADMNDPRYYTAERPAAYGTAASLARFFAALIGEVGGGRLLTPAWAERARAVQCDGLDLVFRLRTRWGLGFMLPGGQLWPECGAKAFGHIGATGALAFADPEHGLAFAFLPNKMKPLFESADRRVSRLIKTAYDCLR